MGIAESSRVTLRIFGDDLVPDELSQDPDVWRRLGAKYRIDLFCGVFMGSTNDGLSFTGNLLKVLCERGIALNLDIYAPCDD
jgi:ribosomal protein L19